MGIPTFDHKQVFEEALSNPNNTIADLPRDDVNATIANSYAPLDRPFTFTLSQLWEMELRKAYHPDKYLGTLVRPGSLRNFDMQKSRDEQFDYFVRVTD